MRKNAEQIEIAAWTLRVYSLVRGLHFTPAVFVIVPSFSYVERLQTGTYHVGALARFPSGTYRVP